MAQLPERVRMLFDGKNFAVLSTLEPDGKPHSTVVWAKRDGDDILFALPKNRRKTANLNRDARAAVVIFDAASPYESAQEVFYRVRGIYPVPQQQGGRRLRRPRSNDGTAGRANDPMTGLRG